MEIRSKELYDTLDLDRTARHRILKEILKGVEPLAKPLVGRVFLPEAEGTDGQRGGTQRS